MRTRLGSPAGRDNGLSKSLATLPERAGEKPYKGQEAPLTRTRGKTFKSRRSTFIGSARFTYGPLRLWLAKMQFSQNSGDCIFSCRLRVVHR